MALATVIRQQSPRLTYVKDHEHTTRASKRQIIDVEEFWLSPSGVQVNNEKLGDTWTHFLPPRYGVPSSNRLNQWARRFTHGDKNNIGAEKWLEIDNHVERRQFYTASPARRTFVMDILAWRKDEIANDPALIKNGAIWLIPSIR